MKFFKYFLTCSISILLASCGILPIETPIKQNHFKFENFKRDIGSPIELVHLMCYRRKPTNWVEPRQYLSGEHELWVEVNISDPDIPSSDKEAFVLFKVKLDPGKSYMLNRRIDSNNISIWIEETDSALRVSEVVTTGLKRAVFKNEPLRKKRCKTGSI